MRKIRQAIPFEELAANMKNQPRSVRSSRYSRKSTFISEQESDARVAAVGLTFGSLAILATALGLWGIWHSVSTAQAQPAPIYAKSEMTRAQIKQLHIMPSRSEKHAPKHK
jgi:hypothetical protein